MIRQKDIARKEKDALTLRPVLTFSDQLLIETPYGEFIINSTLQGIWRANVMESTGPLGEASESLSMIHESLEKETEVPLYLEATKHSDNEILYFFAHRNEEHKVDFYRVVVVEDTKTLN